VLRDGYPAASHGALPRHRGRGRGRPDDLGLQPDERPARHAGDDQRHELHERHGGAAGDLVLRDEHELRRQLVVQHHGDGSPNVPHGVSVRWRVVTSAGSATSFFVT
jgi:hypothetical protein